MKFCGICNSLCYLKDKDDILQMYCKRCDFVEHESVKNETICIKLTDNSDSYSTYFLRNNKNLFKDPTLPKLDCNIIDCINSNCPSNIVKSDKPLYRENENGIIQIYGLNTKLNTKQDLDKIKQILSKKIKIPESNIELVFDDTSNILLCKFTNSKEKIKEFTFVYNDIPCTGKLYINNEIIYFKYDEENLKYLYICSSCNSSWINNIKVNS